MIKVQGTTIIMTRGDTMKIHFSLGDYIPKEGDVIKFGMKKDFCDSECLIEKVIPNDTTILQIEHDDTKDLDFGTYVYDCEITFANGEVNTFISKAVFKITEEVI